MTFFPDTPKDVMRGALLKNAEEEFLETAKSENVPPDEIEEYVKRCMEVYSKNLNV